MGTHTRRTDPGARAVRVQVNVEMDPESEVEARAAMQAAGLNCVGWYHSHPSFKPIPSVIDVSNQLNYQRLCEEATGVQPFVGAIVSPYDLDSNDPIAEISWYFVHCADRAAAAAMKDGGNPLEAGHVAKALKVVQAGDGNLTSVLETVKGLADRYSTAAGKTDFMDRWPGGEMSFMDKAMQSVGHRLPMSWSTNSTAGYMKGIRGLASVSFALA